jgi:hypothetical protein
MIDLNHLGNDFTNKTWQEKEQIETCNLKIVSYKFSQPERITKNQNGRKTPKNVDKIKFNHLRGPDG